MFNCLRLEVVVRFCAQWYAVRGSRFLCSMVVVRGSSSFLCSMVCFDRTRYMFCLLIEQRICSVC